MLSIDKSRVGLGRQLFSQSPPHQLLAAAQLLASARGGATFQIQAAGNTDHHGCSVVDPTAKNNWRSSVSTLRCIALKASTQKVLSH